MYTKKHTKTIDLRKSTTKKNNSNTISQTNTNIQSIKFMDMIFHQWFQINIYGFSLILLVNTQNIPINNAIIAFVFVFCNLDIDKYEAVKVIVIIFETYSILMFTFYA